MTKQLTENEALLRLTALCAGSEQCEWNIRQKMVKWGLESGVQDRIIDRLYDERYIDEERFANAYARDKMRYNHWGRQKIEQMLRLLHIASPAIRQALDTLPDDEYRQILQGLITAKARSVKAANNYERNGKLIRFALGRGFEMQAIRECLPDDGDEYVDEEI